MNRNAISSRSFRACAGVFGAVLVAVFAGYYAFNASAQKDEEKAAPELNGRLVFIRTDSIPSVDAYFIFTNPDGSGDSTVSTSFGRRPDSPAWSPDGTKIVFNSNQIGGGRDIFVMNADGTGMTNLTNTPDTAFESNPTWSVTGKIAYAIQEMTPGAQIWTMNTNGSGQAVFAGITQPAPFDPVWSPDGTKLAFVSGGEIWVINADGTGETRITTNATIDRDPAWSPEGSRIVFSRGGGGISIVNADGMGEMPISTGISDMQPSFSPDGTKIAFRGTSGIWTMDPSGANQVRIYTDIVVTQGCCSRTFTSPAWQPVPQVPNTVTIAGRVAYSNTSLPGVTVDIAGTVNASTITDAGGNYQFSGLPIGGSYSVTPARPRSYFSPPNRRFTNISSSQAANFDFASVCQGPRCVRNGKIAYVRGSQVYTINMDGSGETNITMNQAINADPDYSADGSTIVFSTSIPGNYEIYRMNADGSNPTRLTTTDASEYYPNSSSDGQSVVFVSERDGNAEIYKMNTDGSNQVRLTNNTIRDDHPAFSADSSKIIWTANGSSQTESSKVMTMNADGTNQVQFPAPTAGSFRQYGHYSYSPDGSTIMFTYRNDSISPHWLTWTMNAVNGSGAALFSASGTWGTYSPDGMLVAFTCCSFDNTHRVRVSTSTGTLARTLTPSSTGNALPDWQAIASPNAAPFDFDGDGRTDVAVRRPSDGVWHILGSTDGYQARQWSDPGDVLVPADYDGDRKADIAVWRPSDGNYYVINSFDQTITVENFGQAGDIPTGGDWDGDGRADLSVYRNPSLGTQSYFFYRRTMANPHRVFNSVPWGTTGDKPAVGDYDGDGLADAAVYRGGDWWILQSSNQQYIATHFGIPTDKVVPSDYDGDGKTDMAVYRDGIWYLLRSRDGFTGYGFGIATDQPAPGDYDGDGKADAAILRDGLWWILNSSTLQASAVPFGSTNDKAIAGAFVR